jgi:hypothetical protein
MRAGLPFSAVAAVVASACAASSVQAVTVEEYGDGGLRSPRHLAFSQTGDLYVAEAGRGGDGPCFIGGEGPACFGATGAVTRIAEDEEQSRIVDGLASYANDSNLNGTTDDDGDSGIGPHGITVRGSNSIFVTNGGPTAPVDAEGNPITREALAIEDPAADLFGRLLRVRRDGRFSSLADIYAFERDVNPDAQVANPAIDTNATDVLDDRGRFVISDAGGNSVLVARADGKLRALAVFPNRVVSNPFPFGPPQVPMQAVPTGIVEGPDGAYYMSQLTGFPFPIGGARVYRIDPRTGAATIYATGFTNIMDLAFDEAGTLYVLEIDSNGIILPPPFGAIEAITSEGVRSTVVAPDGTLTEPGGIVVGEQGDLFVSNRSRSPDDGQVLRIELDD